MTTTLAKPVRSCEMSDDADSNKIAMDHGPLIAARTTNHCSRSTVSEVVSTRLDESEVPDWVDRRFSSSQWADVPPARQIRRGLSPQTATRVLAVPVGELSVSDLVYLALARSGYPLQNVRCWCDDQTLILSGFVTRYYHMQVAVEAAMALAKGRRIGVSIEIVPAPDRSLTLQ